MIKNQRGRAGKWWYGLALALLAWLIVTFVLFPNLRIILAGFWNQDRWSLDSFGRIFSSHAALASLGHSLLLGLLLSITCNVVGIFMVLAVSYFKVRGAKWLRLAYMSTIVYSGIVVASGYLFIYGENGFVTQLLKTVLPGLQSNWFQGLPAVLFIMTFACTSNHMMFLRSAIANLDYQTIEAAKLMGASQFQVLRQVVLPTLTPTLTTLTIFLFQTGIGAFSAPLIFGGNQFQTIAPTILTFATDSYSRNIAVALSLILGILQLSVFGIGTLIDRRRNVAFRTKVAAPMRYQPIENRLARWLIHGLAYLIAVILVLPFVLVVIFSFTDAQSVSLGRLQSFTLSNYAQVLSTADTLTPLLTSLGYALLSAVIALVIGTFLARVAVLKRQPNLVERTEIAAMYLPWLLPAPLIALALVTTYGQRQWLVGDQILTGGLILLLVAYVVSRLPYSLRFMSAAFHGQNRALEEAAVMLGASSLRAFLDVGLPAIRDSALAVFSMNALAQLAEYDMTVFLYSPALTPLGVVIKANTDPNGATTGFGVNGLVANLIYSVLLVLIGSLLLFAVHKHAKDGPVMM